MPTNIIKFFVKNTNKSESEIETLWDKTKEDLIKSGYKETNEKFFPILVTILKRKLKINENIRFKNYISTK